MKILFDQGTPVPLRKHLHQHTIHTTYELGWSDLPNGELLDAAEQYNYQLLITTDQNLQHQQDLSSRSIAIIVLLTTSWPRIRKRTHEILAAINEIKVGQYKEISI